MDGWMDGWMDGRTDRWMYKLMRWAKGEGGNSGTNGEPCLLAFDAYIQANVLMLL